MTPPELTSSSSFNPHGLRCGTVSNEKGDTFVKRCTARRLRHESAKVRFSGRLPPGARYSSNHAGRTVFSQRPYMRRRRITHGNTCATNVPALAARVHDGRGPMETDTFFHVVEDLVKGNATYSETTGHRIISLHRLRVIYKQRTGTWPLKLLSLQDAVEEGVRKGYWEMDYDEEADMDIIVLC